MPRKVRPSQKTGHVCVRRRTRARAAQERGYHSYHSYHSYILAIVAIIAIIANTATTPEAALLGAAVLLGEPPGAGPTPPRARAMDRVASTDPAWIRTQR